MGIFANGIALVVATTSYLSTHPSQHGRAANGFRHWLGCWSDAREGGGDVADVRPFLVVGLEPREWRPIIFMANTRNSRETRKHHLGQ